MKKSIYLFAIFMAILMLLSSCKNDTDTDSNPLDTASSETEQTSSDSISSSVPDASEPQEPQETHKYDSEELSYVGLQKEPVTQDKNKTYIDVDGFGSFEVDSDGKVLIDGFTVSDFNGDIVYFYKNPIDKCLVVYSYGQDGKLYLNSYNSNGDKCIYNNTTVTFKRQDSVVLYSKVSSIKFSNTSTAGFVVEINGKYYHNKLDLSLNAEPIFEIINIQDCQKVLALGYRNPYSVVCYSKKDVTNSIFYTCGGIEYTISLPQDYEVNNIKTLYFGSVIYIEMRDGNVCTLDAGRNANFYLLSANESLNQIKADGNVKKIYPVNIGGKIEVYFDMDDGKIYKLIG